ncbi:MAG: hypothetical protein IJ849_10565 [Selenomonadaceae bacterium]|nr:hypothetical protein [Selenomonadaceae bacterium]
MRCWLPIKLMELIASGISELVCNEWWKRFDAQVDKFTFLFITSFLKGNFRNQLNYISSTHNNIKGAAIGVENLLYLAEGLKRGSISPQDFYASFANDELCFAVETA